MCTGRESLESLEGAAPPAGKSRTARGAGSARWYLQGRRRADAPEQPSPVLEGLPKQGPARGPASPGGGQMTTLPPDKNIPIDYG